ncbi:MAG: DUF72 domain-containing protein [Bacillota bacterium]
MREWAPRIVRLAERTRKTFVSMNNHYRGQAVINGRMIRKILRRLGQPVR